MKFGFLIWAIAISGAACRSSTLGGDSAASDRDAPASASVVPFDTTPATSAPTSETALGIATTTIEPDLEFRQRLAAAVPGETRLFVHPRCMNGAVVWADDTRWALGTFREGVAAEVPMKWWGTTDIAGTFIETDELAEFGMATGTFVADDGTELAVTTAGVQQSCTVWPQLLHEGDE